VGLTDLFDAGYCGARDSTASRGEYGVSGATLCEREVSPWWGNKGRSRCVPLLLKSSLQQRANALLQYTVLAAAEIYCSSCTKSLNMGKICLLHGQVYIACVLPVQLCTRVLWFCCALLSRSVVLHRIIQVLVCSMLAMGSLCVV